MFVKQNGVFFSVSALIVDDIRYEIVTIMQNFQYLDLIQDYSMDVIIQHEDI